MEDFGEQPPTSAALLTAAQKGNERQLRLHAKSMLCGELISRSAYETSQTASLS